MTTSFKKSRHKKILALCLSSFMLAAAAASFVACGDSKDSSVDDSEVSTTENDTSRITNGSFEFFEDDNGQESELLPLPPAGVSPRVLPRAVPLPPLRRPAALSIPPRKRGKISLLLRDSLTTRKAKQRQIGITSPQRTSWISTISGRKRTTTTTSRTSISTIRTRIISISTSTTSPIAKIL